MKEFVKPQVQKCTTRHDADIESIVAAVKHVYDVPEGGEEDAFLTTTTQEVSEKVFCDADKQRFDVMKTVSATTSMPGSLVGIPAGTPSFGASRNIGRVQ